MSEQKLLREYYAHRHCLHTEYAIQARVCKVAEQADNWFPMCTSPRQQFVFLKGLFSLLYRSFPTTVVEGILMPLLM